MFSIFYKLRRPLPNDRMHAFDVRAGFGWRLLLRRYGPRWWVLLNRFECWKYQFPILFRSKQWHR